ncbi:MAG: type II toxin-antitoxin system RelE/ParE family toxin [Verrucomicrobia bacterium]|nr:type II toxin-antitoxin system RelE/ParE family toxin [Verrucomicrobiota bacterium]
MSYRLLSDSSRDLETAIAYYEKIHPDLALDFLKDFEHTMQHVVAFPEAWTQVTPQIRRCLFHRFPYAVLYSSQNGIILVTAVMHLHRDTESFFNGRI